MHSQWLRTRRHFFESLKNEIQLIEGEVNEELKNYEAEYKKEFERVWETSDFKELIQKIAQSRFVLAGDFHYFYQSQRTHLRVLRELVQFTKKDFVILLEVFDVKQQEFLDQYLEGHLSWKSFLEKVQWTTYWGNLSPEGFKLILDWGKVQKAKILGVNDFSLNSLRERDQFSGHLIDEIIGQHENSFIYTIYGDFHLAKAHLIRHISSYNPLQDMRLFLNSEDLYFQLSEHDIEDQFDVLKHKDAYCLLSATPWVKFQSYLLYLQELDDTIMAQQEEDFDRIEPDYTEYISGLLEVFRSDFNLPDWRDHLAVITVSERSLKTLENLSLAQQNFTELERDKLNFLISSQRNIVFPKEGIQFLAQPGVNKALCLVGEFIHSQLSQRKSLLWEGPYFMIQRIWVGAVSYFFNLWVNPKVKTPQEEDLMNRLQAMEKAMGQTGKTEKHSGYAQSVLEYAAFFLRSQEVMLAGLLNQKAFSQEALALGDEGWASLFKKSKVGRVTSSREPLFFHQGSELQDSAFQSSEFSYQNERRFFEAENWKIQFEATFVLGKILGERLYKAYKSGLFNQATFLGYLSLPLEAPQFLSMYNHVLMELKSIK